ncbi:MAG: helicase-associated domain-containing protein [Candidatus Sumerlaeaceae bacterium]|nr:helicase-associated domain-containing protein [Candidatus Sumerlaeaceae bacterium]
MKLRTILQKFSKEDLLRVAEFWSLAVPESLDVEGEGDTSRLVEYLYPRMQTAKYYFRTVERLQPLQKTTLKFLAVHGGEVPLGEVIARCYSGEEDKAREELQDLAAKAFVFLDDSEPELPYVVLPESVRSNFELGMQLTGYLGALLQQMAFNDLAALAERVTGDKKYWHMPRERLIRRLREHLLDPSTLQRHVESLPPEEKILFNALVDRDGYAFYGDLLEVGGRRRFDLARTEQLNSLIQNRGLVFQVSEGSNKYGNLLMIPRDILYIVTHDFATDDRSLVELEQLGPTDKDFRPAVVVDNSFILFRDLVTLASFIHGQNFKVLTSGGMSKADLRRVLPLLGPSRSLKYATFLAAFLIWAKYLRPVGGMWRLSDTFSSALASPSQLFAEIYHWWLEVNEWNEAHPEGLLWDEEQPTRGFVALIEMRKLVLEAILSWGAGTGWIPYQAFEELVLPKLVAVAAPTGKADPSVRMSLRRVLYCVVTEALAWLGIVVVGASQKDAFSEEHRADLEALFRKKNLRKNESAALSFSFRPTDTAKLLCETGDMRPGQMSRDMLSQQFPLAFEADWVIVQPNCEIVAPPDLSLPNLLSLCGFCDVKSVDVMTLLVVTRESLQRALDVGVRGEDVRNLLGRLSRSGVPPTVDQLITDILEKHGEAVLGSAGGYILSDDPSVIEQIRLQPKLQEFLKEVIGDKGLVLAPGVNIERVAKELRTLGLMPRVESGAVETTRDNRFHINLSAEEYYELLALLNLIEVLEDELGTEIIEDRGISLIHSIEPDSAGYAMIHEEAQRVSALYARRLKQALHSMQEEIEEKYKSQVSRIVAKAQTHRGPTRFHYRGQNPAVERKDIVALLEFAAQHELETEIQYVKRNETEATLRIYPKSFEGTRVYAYCVESDRDAMYSLDRILKATLV